MLRAAVMCCLVAAVLAHVPYMQWYARIESPEALTAHLNGLLVPVNSISADNVPTYEFRSTVTGAPVAESDHYTCRCSVVEDYSVPVSRDQKPVLLCRNIDLSRETLAGASAADTVFVLRTDYAFLEPHVKEINLLFGKSSYHNVMAANTAGITPSYPTRIIRKLEDKTVHEGGHDMVVTKGHPFETLLEYSPVSTKVEWDRPIKESRQLYDSAWVDPVSTRYTDSGVSPVGADPYRGVWSDGLTRDTGIGGMGYTNPGVIGSTVPINRGPSTYPSASYPSATYPSASYPSATYPSATYPSATYPSATYPSANYPSANYPSATYPSVAYSPSGYPPAANYPSVNPTGAAYSPYPVEGHSV